MSTTYNHVCQNSQMCCVMHTTCTANKFCPSSFFHNLRKLLYCWMLVLTGAIDGICVGDNRPSGALLNSLCCPKLKAFFWCDKQPLSICRTPFTSTNRFGNRFPNHVNVFQETKLFSLGCRCEINFTREYNFSFVFPTREPEGTKLSYILII